MAARDDIARDKIDQAPLIICIKPALEANGHCLKVLEMTWEGQC